MVATVAVSSSVPWSRSALLSGNDWLRLRASDGLPRERLCTVTSATCFPFVAQAAVSPILPLFARTSSRAGGAVSGVIRPSGLR
jgi:hypothetical protein